MLLSGWFPGLVLFVADLFQPVHHFAVEVFLYGDMRHGGRWRSAVPMLLTRREPDYVAGPNFFNRTTEALRQTETRRDNQRLPEGVCARRFARRART